MHEYPIFIFAALLIFVYGLFSRLSEKSPISAAMVFVSVGILAGPLGLDLVEVGLKAPAVRVIAEVTLILVLFIDASTIDLQSLIRRKGLPFRLLFVGLPLTMVLGVILALPLFHGMSIWAIALMAFILSPTDAALGQPVITSPLVPERIKEAINVESGLNDGIALPPVLACIGALSVIPAERTDMHYWIGFTMKQFFFGPLLGAFVGWLGGLLVEKASKRGWMNPTFQRLAAWSLALMAYALAEKFHGNGFIAAFFGGLMLGVHTPAVRERIHEFGEAEGQQLALFVFLLFGLAAVPRAIGFWDFAAWTYAILSLTVIRMLPVALSLRGTKLSRFSVAFIGWFGPRGIASVLYLLIVVNELGLDGYERMLSVIVLTVLLSVCLHGITAVPLSRLYADHKGDRGS
ncbi:MAG TPA: cation:proton antiporter [Thermodesulfovibrionales bacterium]|nr:cation:proton antiporter [Thermodesulfovibrionales bacterium]